MKIKLVIPGKAQAKQRPRIGRNGAYTPQKTKNYENWIKTIFIQNYPVMKPLETPLRVSIVLNVEIPTSISKKKQIEMINGSILPTKKPDVDNVAKSILDALNGLAYRDDKQIIYLQVTKRYAGFSNAEVLIEEMEDK